MNCILMVLIQKILDSSIGAIQIITHEVTITWRFCLDGPHVYTIYTFVTDLALKYLE